MKRNKTRKKNDYKIVISVFGQEETTKAANQKFIFCLIYQFYQQQQKILESFYFDKIKKFYLLNMIEHDIKK